MQNRTVTALHINLETKRVRAYYVGTEGENEGNIDFDLPRDRTIESARGNTIESAASMRIEDMLIGGVTIQDLVDIALNADS